jgi:nicotinamidase-related amidase
MSSSTEQRRDPFTQLHFDERLALMTIDCQSDWVDPDGLYYVASAEEIVPAAASLVEAARAASRPVYHVVRLYLDGGENADVCRRGDLSSGGRFCVPGSEGAELIAELKPAPEQRLDAPLLLSGHPQVLGPRERVFYKPRFGAFTQERLERELRAAGIDSILFCGISFPRCVLASIFGAVDRDFRVGVVPEATSEIEQLGLAFLEAAGVQRVALNEAIEQLSTPVGRAVQA